MNWRAAIVDTNVLVSGLLTPNPEAPTRRIVRGMLTASFPFVLSVALMEEYRVVLERPPIAARHRLAPDELNDLLLRLTQEAIVVEPIARATSPDPGDVHVWSLLSVRQEFVLVTGDGLLLRRAARERVVSPRAFVAALSP